MSRHNLWRFLARQSIFTDWPRGIRTLRPRERQQNSPERARERVRERQSDFFEAAHSPFFWTVNLDKCSFEFAGGACTALWPRASPCASGRRIASCGLSAQRRSSGALARSTCVAVAESCPHVYGRRLSIHIIIILRNNRSCLRVRQCNGCMAERALGRTTGAWSFAAGQHDTQSMHRETCPRRYSRAPDS